MTDLHSKRKFAGPPAAERRKSDPGVQQQHIPPHKKPRDYVLVVEWAESVRYRDVTTYPSKAARTQARVLIEKKLAEHKYFGGWKDRKKGYLYGPVFTEVMLTDQPIEERRKLTEQEAALKGLEALFAKEEK